MRSSFFHSLVSFLVVASSLALGAMAGCNTSPPAPTCDMGCDDGDECTTDACVDATCVSTPIDSPECEMTCTVDAQCPAEACQMPRCFDGTCGIEIIAGCCIEDADCADDGDPCTFAACEGNACVTRPVPACTGCTADSQCDDADDCTTNACVASDCVYAPIAGCEPPCDTAADCDDADDCTADSCDADHACVHDPIAGCGVPTARTIPVSASPEGFFYIPVGGGDFSGGFFELDATHAYVVVATSENIDTIDLDSGAVDHGFSPLAGYDAVPMRAASGDLIGLPGPTGYALQSTGLAEVPSGVPTNDLVPSPPNASGVSSFVLAVQATGVNGHALDFSSTALSVSLASFPGAVTPGVPTSAIFLAATQAMIAHANGQVWSAPLVPPGTTTAPAATLIADLGDATTSLRYTSCTDPDASGDRVCAIADYGDSQLFVLEIDASGDVTVGPAIPCGMGPVEPAVIWSDAMPGRAVIASAGYGDGVVDVHLYDPSTDMVTLLRSDTLASCVGPGHVGFAGDDGTLIVSCHDSNNVIITPVEALDTP
jgi:hypothetical protein